MRRLVDISVSLIALGILSPLLALIAFVIVLDSGGSPFYRALRVGLGGKKFRMWKLRTMRARASSEGPPVTGRNDPRITRVGRILRRSKLDELPQFMNVLTGEMTLVGPRPEAPEFLRWYSRAHRAILLSVKPGITGISQVARRDESEAFPDGTSPEEYYVTHLLEPKLRLDAEYLQTRTALSDAKIVLATAALVLRALVPNKSAKDEMEGEPAVKS